MDHDQARAFIRDNPRGILLTYRSSGAPQMSPIVAGIDVDGYALVSSRETAYKVRNLRRDPRASLCMFTEGFFGGWIQVDGVTDVLSLPQAMGPLVDYYRNLSGEHPDWNDYRNAMRRERRVLIRITIERVGPTRFG